MNILTGMMYLGPTNPSSARGGWHGNAPASKDGLDSRTGPGKGGHRRASAFTLGSQTGHQGAAG